MKVVIQKLIVAHFQNKSCHNFVKCLVLLMPIRENCSFLEEVMSLSKSEGTNQNNLRILLSLWENEP